MCSNHILVFSMVIKSVNITPSVILPLCCAIIFSQLINFIMKGDTLCLRKWTTHKSQEVSKVEKIHGAQSDGYITSECCFSFFFSSYPASSGKQPASNTISLPHPFFYINQRLLQRSHVFFLLWLLPYWSKFFLQRHLSPVLCLLYLQQRPWKQHNCLLMILTHTCYLKRLQCIHDSSSSLWVFLILKRQSLFTEEACSQCQLAEDGHATNSKILYSCSLDVVACPATCEEVSKHNYNKETPSHTTCRKAA